MAQHAFPATGNFTIRVAAVDKDGLVGSVATHAVGIVAWAIQTDPGDPTKTNLVWGGTEGVDAYYFLPGMVLTPAQNNQFFPTMQPILVGSFTGKLIVYSQGGSDLVFADVVTRPVKIYGGAGDDVLVGGIGSDWIDGGDGNDILFGGTGLADGNDTILGGAGDDLIIGHRGADLLRGGVGRDLIVAGWLQYGDQIAIATFSLQAEWLSGRPYATRVANLAGTGSGPRNNGNFFLVPGTTALCDGAIDTVLGDAEQDWLLYSFAVDLNPDLAGDLAGETPLDVPCPP